MSLFTNAEADALSLDGLVNDNALVSTRRNGPKPSYQFLVDGWNAEFAAKIIEINKSKGFRVVGTFAAGFTYELLNDVGIDANGNSWIYVGTAPLPLVVTAGTVPSTPNYQQVTYNDHSGLVNLNTEGGHDEIYARSVNSLKSLVAYTPTLIDGQKFNVTGFYLNTSVGGGLFAWDSSCDKSTHNGGTVISPEALIAWDGTSLNISTLLNWTGAGNGCFLRIYDVALVEHFGASQSVSDCAPSINKALEFSGAVRKPVFAYGERYNHSGINVPSFSSLIGSGKYLTEFYLNGGSDRASFQLLTPTEIRMTLRGFSVNGNSAGNAVGSHGINFISEVDTSGNLAVRATIDDIFSIDNNGMGVQLEGTTGFASFTRLYMTNVISSYNKQHGFRFRRMTDSTLFGLFSNGNVLNGYNIDNCANNKFNSMKTAYNTGDGWLATGCRRNSYVQCEAQEDFSRGALFYAEEDSSLDFIFDANGRAGAEGLGARIQLCKRCNFKIKSMSFQVPTWQDRGIQLSANLSCKIDLQNNDSVVPSAILVEGIANDDIYIHQVDKVSKLTAGSGALQEVGDLSYTESSFLPVIEFETNGDTAVTYSIRDGYYTISKGRIDVFIQVTATVTHSTASGALKISGLPAAASNKVNSYAGSFFGSAVDTGLPSLTQINPVIFNGQQYVKFIATKYNTGYETIDASNVASGSSVIVGVSISYLV